MHDRFGARLRVSLADHRRQDLSGGSIPRRHGTYIVMFDPQTKLPAIVRTRDFDQFVGDSNFDATYSDWRDVNRANSRSASPTR